MAKPKVFQYRINKKNNRPLPTGKAFRASADEGLTRFINGIKASDIEERFYRSMKKQGITNFEFRPVRIAGRNMPGSIEIDFKIESGGLVYIIQIDGSIGHKTAEQKGEDAVKDAILNNLFQGYALPVIRIPGEELDNQDDADRVVREIFR